jgi:uncharacterized repeat protein (TIGR02543 family)
MSQIIATFTGTQTATSLSGWTMTISDTKYIYTSPPNQTAIADSCFASLTQLIAITIPDSVTSIGWKSFYGCTNLTSITIPNSVTSIANSAFNGCTNLTSIIIPNSVISIGTNVFQNCSAVTSVTIGNSVTSIGDNAFYSCPSLTSVTFLGNTIPFIGINNFTISGDTAYYYFGTTNTSALTMFTNKVEYNALKYTYNLSNNTASVTGFSNAQPNWTLSIPATVTNADIVYNVTSIGTYAFQNCSALASVTIPNSVTIIGNNVFQFCSALTSVTIPDAVTSIGNYAFQGCSFVTSVSIGISVTSIGDYAFSTCSKLTSITIPNSVTSMGNAVLHYCNALASVTIGSSVTRLGDSAFYNCFALTSITIPNSVTSLGNDVFYNCNTLTSIIIPDSVTSIGTRIFQFCSALRSVTIGSSVTSIGYATFYSCSNLTSVTIGKSVTSIDLKAFNGCSALTSVTIPNLVTSIGESAFDGCSALTSVTIPSSVTSIGANAFQNCLALTSVTIPSSVTSIGVSAFQNCSKITTAIIQGTTGTISTNAFNGCIVLVNITIYQGKILQTGIFTGCTKLTTSTLTGGKYLGTITTDSVQGDTVYNYFLPPGKNGLYLNYTQLYTVTYSSVYGTVPVDSSSPYNSGSQVTVSTLAMTQTNFIFNGWNTQANGSGTSYSTSSSFTIINNTILYAQWVNPLLSIKATFKTLQGTGTTHTFGGQSYTLTSSNPFVYYSVSQIIDTIASSCFYNTDLIDIVIPAAVLYINFSAFQNCTQLTSIIIPATVKNILDYSFSGCTLLNTAVILCTTGAGIGTGTFSGCTLLKTITIYQGIYTNKDIFKGCSLLENSTPDSQGSYSGTIITDSLPGQSVYTYFFPVGNTSRNITGLYLNYINASTLDPRCNVIYNGNGSTGGLIPVDYSSPYIKNTLVTVLDNPNSLSKTGFIFNGWNTQANGSGTSYSTSSSFTITANIILYAQWVNPLSIKATFNGTHGTTATFGGQQYTTTSTSSPFVYYSVNTNITDIDNNAFDSLDLIDIVISSTVINVLDGAFQRTLLTSIVFPDTVTGIFTGLFSNCYLLNEITINNNNVVFWGAENVFNDCILLQNSTPDSNGRYSGTIITDSVPGQKVYNYFFPIGNTSGNKSGKPTGLYLNYINTAGQSRCNVIYNSNGSTGGSVPVDNLSPYSINALVTVLPNSLVKTGFIFTGWNTQADGSGGYFSSSFTIITNTILYAQWVNPLLSIKATFKTLQGTGTTHTFGGEKYTLTSSNPFVYYSVSQIIDTIASSCFYNTDLIDIVIPAAVTDIYDKAFEGTVLTSIVIPVTVTGIFKEVFKGCSLLTSITISNSVTFWGGYDIFKGCSLLQNSTPDSQGSYRGTIITDSMPNDPTYDFFFPSEKTGFYLNYINTAGQSRYNVIYDGNGQTTGSAHIDSLSPYINNASVIVSSNIGSLIKTGYTFNGWNTQADGSGTPFISSFTILNNTILYAQWVNPLLSIKATFNGTHGTTATFGGQLYTQSYINPFVYYSVNTNITFIDVYAFSNLDLIDIVIPSTVTHTYDLAFFGCTLLTSIVIPATLTSISPKTFGDCTLLNSITINNSTTILYGSIVFKGCSLLENSTPDSQGSYSGTIITDSVPGQTVYDYFFPVGNTNGLYLNYINTAGQSRYNVIYDGNGFDGGSVPIDDSSPYINNTSVTLLGNTGSLTRSGYTFTNWNTKEDGSGTSISSFPILNNTILYAQWTQTYTLTYDDNGSVGGAVPTDNTLYPANTSVTVLDNTGALTKPEYTFTNWNTQADSKGTSYSTSSSFTILNNTILYAQWTQITYSVTYDGNGFDGGLIPTDNSSPYNTGISVTVLGNTGALTRSGYIFTNWNIQTDGKGTSYSTSSSFTILNNTILYAQWTPITYSVTYDGNGFDGGLTPVDILSPYINNTSVTVLGNTGSLTKSGYTFTNWNTQAAGKGTSYFTSSSFTILNNTILYAQWTQITYSVTYNGNGFDGGTVPTDNSSPYINNTSVTVLGNTGLLTKTGYKFTNWNIQTDGKGTIYNPNSKITITDNTILYAQWTLTYNLTYDGNGFDGGLIPVDILSPYNTGISVTVLAGSLTKTGYTFTNWNTQLNGLGTSFQLSSTFTILNNTILYAQWTLIPQITYNVKYYSIGDTGGSVPSDKLSPYNSGTSVIVLGNTGSLIKIGYIFYNWNTQADGLGTSYSTSYSFTILNNTNLYAQWSQTYNLTYDGNGFEGGLIPIDNSSPYISGTSVTVLDNTGSLTKTGYAFTSWNIQADGSGTSYNPNSKIKITDNTFLYAQWTQTYNLTYDGNGFEGGLIPTDNSSPYINNTSVTVLAGSLTKSEYTFTNWNTKSDGKGTSYNPNSKFKITDNTILYAQWSQTQKEPESQTYNVTYDGNGHISGTVPTDILSPYNSGTSITISGNTGSLTKTSYTFNGWNTQADGFGVSYIYNSSFTIENDTTLYAQWILIPVSHICFEANTLIKTNKGLIPIKQINPDIHTINKKKIIAITKTIASDKYLVCFDKDSLGLNYPSEKTIMSKYHKIYYDDVMTEAFKFVDNYQNVTKINYDGEILYNILLEEYDTIIVNNLICETLHPQNIIAKLYTSNYNEECKNDIILLMNYYIETNNYADYNNTINKYFEKKRVNVTRK